MCNQNRVHCRRFKEFIDRESATDGDFISLKDLDLFLLYASCSENFTKYTDERIHHNQQQSLSHLKFTILEIRMYKLFLGRRKQSPQNKRDQMFSFVYMAIMNSSTRQEIGHQLNDFIKSCTFGGYDCPVDNR